MIRTLAIAVALLSACTKREATHADDSRGALTATIPSSSAGDSTDIPISSSAVATAATTTPPPNATCRKAPPGALDPGVSPGSCKSDSDCKEKPEGRCKAVNMGHGRESAACTYDACQSDADCAAATLCLCGAGYTGRNVCLPGNCHDDADCPHSKCGSVPAETNGGYIPNGRYCHGPRDKCQSPESCGPNKTCGYQTSTSRWECVTATYPPPG